MITRSNTEMVLEWFFKYPDKKFHLRELERMTGLSMPGVRKITARLEKEGFLTSKKEKMVKNFFSSGSEKFTQSKRAHNLYSIFSSGLLDFLKKEYEEPEAIVLFGSYSKGEDISKSDIDIAIITAKHKEADLSLFEKRLARQIRLYEIRLNKSEKGFINSLCNGIVLSGYLEVA
ncbi:nucleotidyltransferase domain-containing protein [Candidatus Woesearchaeota archaeon]|nr:nucleotidyltransferase domain-containing protein [Candidatus Woesearchaeota archaeon]